MIGYNRAPIEFKRIGMPSYINKCTVLMILDWYFTFKVIVSYSCIVDGALDDPVCGDDS